MAMETTWGVEVWNAQPREGARARGGSSAASTAWEQNHDMYEGGDGALERGGRAGAAARAMARARLRSQHTRPDSANINNAAFQLPARDLLWDSRRRRLW